MIVVLLETDAEGVTDTSLETLRFARDLAAEGGGVPVHGVVVGEVPEVDELGKHGVSTLYAARGEGFASYAAAAWAVALIEARDRAGAVVITAAGTPRGNEVLAHVAARLDVPMAANVVAFAGLSPLVVTRQVAGGAALEEMQLPVRPAVFSVAGHAVEARPADVATQPTVEEFEPVLDAADLVARVVSTEPGAPDQSGDLKSARVVVGAGRGAGGPDGFTAVSELADLLGGQLGVSRVVTSLGWRPHHEQVGQTGSRIAPDLYVPCGISGAIQHWAGCASSKTILAVNTDAEAPMMTKATYAVVGDMHEVVPAIIEEIRRRA
ncbi:electron transfer flavoprotein subunit alpha/FixB family protein [Nocardioides sp. JQ2195]|uniref:electron transfer flavoprotein subunit alpha/FixB family protein n=1 Tax=Nocardioides sp. JQ2195 TaxID=2592334 RepID=UPI00143E187F|nr:electron transfer flavoprotein subunit alpha/FixB family protein [Nocardioides sp. JQ2195]QIX25211.1 electron transfer flavoprotein subunit alpha/FixB family protein [Nocardioides sp. JQ2195]